MAILQVCLSNLTFGTCYNCSSVEEDIETRNTSGWQRLCNRDITHSPRELRDLLPVLALGRAPNTLRILPPTLTVSRLDSTMAESAFGPGTIVRVRQFHYPAQPLWVEMVSSVDDDVGSGATARIYKGRAGPPGYTYEVALKVIPDLLNYSKQQVLEQLIRREVDAISRLSERQMRRILPFIGVTSMQFHMIIVSHYMRNGNLLQYFRVTPEADRQRLVIQVAEGVYWLHEFARIVHGDLKCENVLVNDEGDAVIADFGLSTLVEHEASNLTTISAIRGMSTLPFAAPEVLFPPERAKMDERPRSKTRESDVYAFGMMTLQAFSSMRPWPELSEFAIVAKLMNRTTHPRPSDEVTMLGLTNSWWAVCLRCWETDPHARPTMELIWQTLEEKRRNSRTLISDIEGLFCLAVTPCGKRIVTGSEDGTVAIWDWDTGESIGGPLCGHTGWVYHIAVSPDGSQICSCGADRTIRRWDTESGVPIGEPIIGHGGDVTSVAFSPDGTRIASGSFDTTVRLWDATTGAALADPLRGLTDWVRSIAFSPDGACIASGSHNGTIRLWDTATGTDLGVLHHPATEVYSVCFSPDRIHLVSGCADGNIRIWNISTRQLERNIQAHSRAVQSVAVSPSGRYIASGSVYNLIRIWDAQTGDAVGAPLTPHAWRLINSVAFSPDGRSLVAGSSDKTVRIWDLFE